MHDDEHDQRPQGRCVDDGAAGTDTLLDAGGDLVDGSEAGAGGEMRGHRRGGGAGFDQGDTDGGGGEAVLQALGIARQQALAGAVDVVGATAAIAGDGTEDDQLSLPLLCEAVRDRFAEERRGEGVDRQGGACARQILLTFALFDEGAVRDVGEVDDADTVDQGLDGIRVFKIDGLDAPAAFRVAYAQVVGDLLQFARVTADQDAMDHLLLHALAQAVGEYTGARTDGEDTQSLRHIKIPSNGATSPS